MDGSHEGGRPARFVPLIYAHINPYGLFELDMEQRLPLESRLVA